MRLLIFNLIIGSFLFSCNAQTNNIVLGEKYSSSKKPSEYNLYLKKDSTFLYTIGFGGSLVAKCEGKWKFNNIQDSIILKCDPEETLASLTNTYMSDRINMFKITENGKKLKNRKII
jgi:hypothetical protein